MTADSPDRRPDIQGDQDQSTRSKGGPNDAYLAIVQSRLKILRSTLQTILQEKHARFIWEIGSGHGHFLIKYASTKPASFFVGIDLLSDRLRKATKKQQTSGVVNACFLKAKAEEFLECVPAGVSIEEVLILFPDPWPKKRHHKNRLIQERFLDSLATRMQPGGKLYFRTDYQPYLDWTREMISRHPRWELLSDAPWAFEEPTVFQGKATSYGSLVAGLKTPSLAERTTG